MTSIENKQTLCARYLLLGLIVSIPVSPTLTSFLELAIYTLFLVTPELRKRFTSTLSQPIVTSGLILCGFIVLSSLWSSAPWEEKLEHIISWRKILFLPIAASLLYSSKLKQIFLVTFIISMSCFAIVSWAAYLFDFQLLNKHPNHLLRNHATQGIVFFVAAFSSTILLFYQKHLCSKYKAVFFIASIIILSNCFFITTSRSAYVAGLILAICFTIYAEKKKSIFFAPIACLIFTGILYLSPTPHSQIKKVWSEIVNVNTTSTITSSGARLVFWQNTIPIIKKTPLAGHGLKSMALEYKKEIDGQNGWESTITRDPHNQYLLILVEQGAVGLIIFFCFIFYCFKQKSERLYTHIGRSVLLVWLGNSMFNGHFSASVEGKFIFLWCGAMLATPLSKNLKAPHDNPLN